MPKPQRLCERLCYACQHHHAHDFEGGKCLSGEKSLRETQKSEMRDLPAESNRCPCPHLHGLDGLEPGIKTFQIELTKDELTILHYVVPSDSHGDPLKDTYELGKDEPEDSYAALKTLYEKISKLRW